MCGFSLWQGQDGGQNERSVQRVGSVSPGSMEAWKVNCIMEVIFFFEYGALNVVPVVFESCWFRLLLSLVQPNRLNAGQLLSFNTSHS